MVVAINLSGGNDGLNTVVPLFQYDRYRELRPTLAIPRESVLTLSNAPEIGLNPALGALHTLYGEGKVAVFPGVGAPGAEPGTVARAVSRFCDGSGDDCGR